MKVRVGERKEGEGGVVKFFFQNVNSIGIEERGVEFRGNMEELKNRGVNVIGLVECNVNWDKWRIKGRVKKIMEKVWGNMWLGVGSMKEESKTGFFLGESFWV